MIIKIAQGNEDIKKISELANVIWHEFFTCILSDEQIDYMVEKYQSYPAILKAVNEDGYHYYMAYDGDDLCGYLGIHDEGEGTIFISKVYVRSDKRKRGIASLMLDRLREDFPDAKKWYLTVNRHNSGSIAVYEKRGFYKAREQVADIGNGFVMDDYVMQKDF
ncbi:MAG: GNAT family N-acetyltransferase [Oscillospiraceae bacterium]|nr:GNAT family N-acetyltransferase [Oscillospiraceae bacterium]